MKNKLSINLEVSLVEIILSVLIFAICGVVMLNCFFIARFTQVKANDKTIAIMKAQSAFEYIKSTKNSSEMNELLKSTYANNYYDDKNNSNVFVDYYDANWKSCNDIEKEYFIKIQVSDESINSGEMNSVNITIEKSKPYPFIDKVKDKAEPIISIETKKFFPNFELGGQ